MPGQGRLGDKAQVPADAHGCPACPHPAIGPAIIGSPNVNVNGRPALRVDDKGMHAACCGPNMWTATKGSSSVFINGKAAHRLGDANAHCGGNGQLVEGSADVIVGDSGGGGSGSGGGSTSDKPGGAGGSGASASASGQAGSTSAAEASQSEGQSSSSSGSAAAIKAHGSYMDKSPAPDRHVLSVEMSAINDGPLAGEGVSVIDPDTKQVIAQAEADAQGRVRVPVPENKAYDIRIDGAPEDAGHDPRTDDALTSSHAFVALFDKSGERLGEGVKVTLKGAGKTFEAVTGPNGSIDPLLPEGEYELHVNSEKFTIHTLRAGDLKHAGGRFHELQLGQNGDDPEPDYNAVEPARANRIPSSDVEE